ncbi:hypothetical protein TRFO_27244 [Tritrichomonas foetus]|uniref:Uncharacterized protein n=1 Tax=Tritrichomonas foetus TaxID=1144522 RepID=A0A1J4K1A9_9EUKA|nr:hypothetical protein TRFO_27244 [Tritrichomonas foetus]|eukprot:OHT05167.1 hypothetical protein TRFO_27244 [Tritrichomonas foetus]
MILDLNSQIWKKLSEKDALLRKVQDKEKKEEGMMKEIRDLLFQISDLKSAEVEHALLQQKYKKILDDFDKERKEKAEIIQENEDLQEEVLTLGLRLEEVRTEKLRKVVKMDWDNRKIISIRPNPRERRWRCSRWMISSGIFKNADSGSSRVSWIRNPIRRFRRTKIRIQRRIRIKVKSKEINFLG